MQIENNTWINQQIVSQHEDPTVLEIENEIKHMKNSLKTISKLISLFKNHEYERKKNAKLL